MGDRRIEHDIFGTDPRPRSILAKNKGNRNERTAAKFLTEWTGVQFNRTPSSGGMHLRNQLFCGDLVCVDERFFFPFVVETKHLKNLHVTENLRSNSEVFRVFRQAQRDADRIGKRPMCLIRTNGMDAGDWYLVLEREMGLKLHARSSGRGVGMVGSGTAPDSVSVVVFRAAEMRKAFKWEPFCRAMGITGSKVPPP